MRWVAREIQIVEFYAHTDDNLYCTRPGSFVWIENDDTFFYLKCLSIKKLQLITVLNQFIVFADPHDLKLEFVHRAIVFGLD